MENLLLATPGAIDHEPEECTNANDILIEEIDNHVAVSSI